MAERTHGSLGAQSVCLSGSHSPSLPTLFPFDLSQLASWAPCSKTLWQKPLLPRDETMCFLSSWLCLLCGALVCLFAYILLFLKEDREGDVTLLLSDSEK